MLNEADVDLPPGVTAGDVAERRDRLASGLLAEAYPATYAGWTAENVTAAVKPHGLCPRARRIMSPQL